MRFAYFHIIHNFLFFLLLFFIRHSCVAVVGRECGQRTELGAVDDDVDDVDDAIVVLILLITLVNENKGEGEKKREKQGGGGGMLIDAGLG